mgnify:CR=1 FL=1
MRPLREEYTLKFLLARFLFAIHPRNLWKNRVGRIAMPPHRTAMWIMRGLFPILIILAMQNALIRDYLGHNPGAKPNVYAEKNPIIKLFIPEDHQRIHTKLFKYFRDRDNISGGMMATKVVYAMLIGLALWIPLIILNWLKRKLTTIFEQCPEQEKKEEEQCSHSSESSQ